MIWMTRIIRSFKRSLLRQTLSSRPESESSYWASRAAPKSCRERERILQGFRLDFGVKKLFKCE